MNVFAILYLSWGILYLALGMFSIISDPKSRLNKHFFLMCIALTYWAILFTLKNQSVDAVTACRYHVLSTFSWAFIHCMLLHFTLILTGRNRRIDRKYKVLILYLPALLSIYLYYFQPPTAENFLLTGLGWIHITATDRGFLWTYFFNAYYLTYMAMVVVLLVKWLKRSKLARERKQAKLILTTISFAIITGGVTDLLLPVLGIPVVPALGVILVAVPMTGIFYAMIKYKLMDLNPENFVLQVLKVMNEGLVIVDHNGVIKDINNGALKLLNYDKNQLINSSVKNILGENVSLSSLKNCSSLEVEMRDVTGKEIPVLMSSSVLMDEWGDNLGTVGIFQDISAMKLVQKKLMNSYDQLESRVAARTQELIDTNKALEHEISVRAEMEEKVTHLAYYDHLTGLPNRRLFNDRLKQCMIDASRSGKVAGVLFLDIDAFKRINDTMGHIKGDELLYMVSKRLLSVVRESDTVCRTGGDEFLILIKNLGKPSHIEGIADKILKILKLPFSIDNNDLYITTSIGGSIYPVDGEDVDSLIKNSDIAMYRAKEQGKNQFMLCSPGIKNSVIEELNLTNHLYRALERNEFQLYYQPQINLVTGEITGMEALIRWFSPELGMVSPRIFIPIAEKTGLILPIGEWVIRCACTQNKKWQDNGLLKVPVSVNLSVNQFQNINIAEQIIKVLEFTKLDPKYLELEITEGIIMKNKEYGYALD